MHVNYSNFFKDVTRAECKTSIIKKKEKTETCKTCWCHDIDEREL